MPKSPQNNLQHQIWRYQLLPAARASLQASTMLCLTSGLSSAMVSPTATKRSTAHATAAPTRCTAAPPAAASPRVATRLLIWWTTKFHFSLLELEKL